ncbi:MAG TPA: hypothetical protein VJ810_09905 [Blastocatellia bacterium]|nr:hypothetical protein [Blastocatellia bacterium]
MESRQLSSSGTFIPKYFFPVVMVAATSLVFLHPIISSGELILGITGEPIEAWSTNHLLSSLLIAVITIILLRYASKLKEVWLEADTLRVRNYLKTIQVPLELIERVRLSDGRYKSITVHLRQESEFGKKIYFVPRGAGTFSSEWEKFPDEILRAAEEARRRNARLPRSKRRKAE